MDICTWIEDSSKLVFWLYGAAGLGKSTLMHELVNRLQSVGRLATFTFFTFGSGDDAAQMIRMMSRELAAMHSDAIPNIAKAIRNCDGTHVSIREYLAAYIIDPIHLLYYPHQLVIVIDALDEWSYYEVFLKELECLPKPSPVKFIITSRPNQSIEQAFSNLAIQQYPLAPVSQHVVEEYFQHHFDNINWRGKSPEQHTVTNLAVLANGLLVWAATVCASSPSHMTKKFSRMF